MTTEAGQPRRTQAQRSAEMRQRLLEAAVNCLIEFGYAGTTTARVMEKAGVTRGAQLHHFPTKEDLVVAAIDHLAQQRARAALDKLKGLQDSPDPISAVLDFLWEVHQGPMFAATVELWVAARTDPVLAREVGRVETIVNDTLLSAVGEIFPEIGAPKPLRNTVYTAMDTLHGIMVPGLADHDPAATRRRWNRACVDLRKIMVAALSSSPD